MSDHHRNHVGVAVLCTGLLLGLLSSSVTAACAHQPPGVSAGTEGRALPQVPKPRRELRLAILPDRTTGRPWGMKYLVAAIEDLNRVAPDAVFSIGDMLQGYTRSLETWDREAEEFLQHLQPLQAPFYPVAGNHDVVSGTRDRRDGTFEDRYRETFAPLYYAVEFDLATLIVCLSDDRQFERGFGLGGPQVKWLTEQLQSASERQKPIFVLLHRPLWRSTRSGWMDTVHPLLVEAGVTAVIAGHLHSMQRDPDVDGVEYHILGVCGGMIDQHPLTGQFHHLTFLSIDDTGAVRVYHQPAGVTLPDDFIVREDQDRAFRLKRMTSDVRLINAAPDPFHAAVKSTLQATVRNPLDVPVRVDVSMIRSKPTPAIWDDASWISRTQLDIFNEFVTEADTPFFLSPPPAPMMMDPGETAVIDLAIECPRQPGPVPPAELWFTFSFHDSKGRTVPVILRRRLPIDRVIPVGTVGKAEKDHWWQICAWSPSVYDTEEANPVAAFELLDDDQLRISIRVPDDVRSGYEDEDEPIASRAFNPRSDAVLIDLGSGSQTRRFFVEPFRGEGVWEITEGREPAAVDGAMTLIPTDPESDHVWQIEILLPVPRELRFKGQTNINVGVADNDQTYHTQWRWIAPRDRPARLVNSPR